MCNRFLIEQAWKAIDTSRKLMERERERVQSTKLQAKVDGMAIFLHFH